MRSPSAPCPTHGARPLKTWRCERCEEADRHAYAMRVAEAVIRAIIVRSREPFFEGCSAAVVAAGINAEDVVKGVK